MYNYHTLLEDLQERLNILRSLPVCSIVFNKKAEIIEINKAASDFLRIKNIEEYASLKLPLEAGIKFRDITERLSAGETVRNEKFELKRASNTILTVSLNVSLLYGLKDVFVFQFTEIQMPAATEN